MYDVNVISTKHKLNQINDLKELYKIIEGIKPEVIFEELNYSCFDEAYNKQEPFSIETYTITKYIQNYLIEHIPVDTHDMQEINGETEDYLEKYIYENDNKYQKILDKQKQLISQDGLKATNSKQFHDLTEMRKKQEEMFYQNTDNEKYKKTYKDWIEFNNNREYEMIKNIYNYSERHKYNKAIFLIGADHINSIKKKIQEYKKK